MAPFLSCIRYSFVAMTNKAEIRIAIDVHLKVVAYPTVSARTPPSRGPNNCPVILPVCNVPSTRPAISLGVWVEIKAWDIEMKPAKIPIKDLRTNNCQTDVTKPIKRIEKPNPNAEKIKIFFRPYRSPIRPQIGEKIKAVTNVTPNVIPAHCCTYCSE